MNHEINVQQGFPDELRASAARLYDAAFGARLSIAIPNTAMRITVLKKGFSPVFSFVAVSGGGIGTKLLHHNRLHQTTLHTTTEP